MPLRKIYIVGNRGNMGTRYAACLNELGISHMGSDYGEQIKIRDCDGVIVASPTNTHEQVLHELADHHNIAILCEKPVIFNIERLKLMVEKLNKRGISLRMVNQYEEMDNPDSEGGTYYNYFRTGGDGLGWDCINIVGLARGDVAIKRSDPVWKCALNGHHLKLEDVDYAYIKMIDKWTRNPTGNERYLIEAHERVKRLYGDKLHEGLGRDPGEIRQLTATREVLKGDGGFPTS